MTRGKAFLTITRLDGESHWDVHASIQSCSTDNQDLRDCLIETFQLMEWDLVPLPAVAHKLAVGDTARVSVVYEMTLPCYENAEDGPDLELVKERVRRVQRRKA